VRERGLGELAGVAGLRLVVSSSTPLYPWREGLPVRVFVTPATKVRKWDGMEPSAPGY
jgi:hypothetical protein